MCTHHTRPTLTVTHDPLAFAWVIPDLPLMLQPYVKRDDLTLLTQFGRLCVMIITRQFSISHLVGTRDLKKIFVPVIVNGIKNSSSILIPNNLDLSVTSSQTDRP
jgi:hypothetical protein